MVWRQQCRPLLLKPGKSIVELMMAQRKLVGQLWCPGANVAQEQGLCRAETCDSRQNGSLWVESVPCLHAETQRLPVVQQMFVKVCCCIPRTALASLLHCINVSVAAAVASHSCTHLTQGHEVFSLSTDRRDVLLQILHTKQRAELMVLCYPYMPILRVLLDTCASNDEPTYEQLTAITEPNFMEQEWQQLNEYIPVVTDKTFHQMNHEYLPFQH